MGYSLAGAVSLVAGSGLVEESFLMYTVCLSPKVLSGIVGIGLRRVWVRSVATCIASSFDNTLGNVRVAGGNSAVSQTNYLATLRV